MPVILEDQPVLVQGSAKEPYVLKNTGGVLSCSCPAWRNAGGAIDARTCKHLRAHCGDEAEAARLGIDVSALGQKVPARPRPAASAASSAGTASGSAPVDASGAPPPVLLAHSWEGEDLTGWWLSEKLDGVRAYWDGARFLSRLGNSFLAPSWFTAGLPAHPLDGELWVGRGAFQRCVSIVRRQDQSAQWSEVRYLVFDAPHLPTPFEARLSFLEALWSTAAPANAQLHPHVRCTGTEHLRSELLRVEALGGEGLMLRRPGSLYEAGRSSTLLKVKTFHDAEGRVIGHEPGKGKHKGRLGALVVQTQSGVRFNVGTGFTDDERKSPPAIGDLIVYRYQELTKDGVPRFPSYVGVPADKNAPSGTASAAALAASAQAKAAAAQAAAAHAQAQAAAQAAQAQAQAQAQAAGDAAVAAALDAEIAAEGEHDDSVPLPAASAAFRRFVRGAGDAARVWAVAAVGDAVVVQLSAPARPHLPARVRARRLKSPVLAQVAAGKRATAQVNAGYVRAADDDVSGA